MKLELCILSFRESTERIVSDLFQLHVEIMAVLTHLQRNEELPVPSSGKNYFYRRYRVNSVFCFV